MDINLPRELSNKYGFIVSLFLGSYFEVSVRKRVLAAGLSEEQYLNRYISLQDELFIQAEDVISGRKTAIKMSIGLENMALLFERKGCNFRLEIESSSEKLVRKFLDYCEELKNGDEYALLDDSETLDLNSPDWLFLRLIKMSDFFLSGTKLSITIPDRVNFYPKAFK